jgi:hypothetical protein
VTDFSDIEREILVRGLDDWVGLWEVAKEVRSRSPSSDFSEIMALAVSSVRKLHEAGTICVGELAKSGFVPWSLPPAASAERIELEWTKLGRDPNIGEICWLDNTVRGDELARSILRGADTGTRASEARRLDPEG